MKPSTVFVSALLISGTLAESKLIAHQSGPAEVRAPKTAPAAGRGFSKGGPSMRQVQPNREMFKSHVPAGGHEDHKTTFGKDGHIRDLHAGGMDAHHHPDGVREVREERHDHSVLRASHGDHRYIQRSYSYHGHEFANRTYFVHGVAHSHFYQPYFYRGIAFHVYAPSFYYSPVFYGWAYAPWAASVTWSWGWAGNPWYRYYGAWFTPYPVYTSPSLWLTDYLVAQTLQTAYEERFDAAAEADARGHMSAADFASTPMTSEVKQAIAEEVRRQIALENSEARAGNQNPPDPGSSGLARMLSDRTAHVFVVDTRLDVMSGSGTCSIGEGDVIQLVGQTPSNAVNANLIVLASKGRECARNSIVTVGLADLQEMQNHMRETLDQGLAELQSKQGNGGLPPAPPAAMKAPVQTEFAAIAPPPDPNDEAEAKHPAAR